MRFNRTGFTLIELIIVIVIIGILASIATPMILGIKTKAICAEAVMGMSAIRSALMQHYIIYRSYPSATILYKDVTASNYPDLYDALKPEGLLGVYFSAGCYWTNNQGSGYMYILCSAWPENQIVGGQNDAPKYLDTRNIIDPNPANRGCLYMSVTTGKYAQWNISKSGYDDISTKSYPWRW